MSPCIVLQRAIASENVGNVTVGDVGLLRSSFQEDSAKAAGISVRLSMQKTMSAALDSSWPRLTIVPVFYFAGAAIVRSKTSPSWIGSGRVFWQSLPLVAYMRPPEVILEVRTPRNREKNGAGRRGPNALLGVAFTLVLASQLSLPVVFLRGPTPLLCIPAENVFCQTAPSPLCRLLLA